MNKARLNKIILLLFLLLILIIAALIALKIKDARETRTLFRKELSLFDKSAGRKKSDILIKSVRSLYGAADTADKWLMIIKRSHLIGRLYGDYGVYLEASARASEKFKRNPLIHALYIDSLIRNSMFQRVLNEADERILDEKYAYLVTEAYARLNSDDRRGIEYAFPFKEVLDNPDENALLEALDDLEDPRLLLDASIARAVDGRIGEALDDVPYGVEVNFPEAYAVLAYDSGKYDLSVKLISEIERKFHIVPAELRHLSYDAMYSAGRRKQAYEGYSLLEPMQTDWRPGLNLLLGHAADNREQISARLESDFSHIYAVNWYLADYWYGLGNTEKALSHYRKLLAERPDIIEARVRISEIENGYIAPGKIRDILWELYYSDDPAVVPEAKENAALYLMWYALGAQDSGVVEFFRNEENITRKMMLMIAMWDTVNGNPERCLETLQEYQGPYRWFARYLMGIASMAEGRYDRSVELFSSIHTADRDTEGAVRMKRAQALYYAGNYRGAMDELEYVMDTFPGQKGTKILEKKIMEKL